MRARQVFDDRQPKPGAANLARTSAVDAIEPLKETVKVLRRDSFAGIGNHYVIATTPFKLHSYLATFTIELDGVVDQVSQHLFQPAGIGKHKRIHWHFVNH